MQPTAKTRLTEIDEADTRHKGGLIPNFRLISWRYVSRAHQRTALSQGWRLKPPQETVDEMIAAQTT